LTESRHIILCSVS